MRIWCRDVYTSSVIIPTTFVCIVFLALPSLLTSSIYLIASILVNNIVLKILILSCTAAVYCIHTHTIMYLSMSYAPPTTPWGYVGLGWGFDNFGGRFPHASGRATNQILIEFCAIQATRVAYWRSCFSYFSNHRTKDSPQGSLIQY